MDIDALFPSTNWLGIPDLLNPFIISAVPLPVQCWGFTSRSKKNYGTWHFYTDDYRFNALERNPARVLETGCHAVTEINYSVFDDTPTALVLATIYKKRYIARLWQESGINVFIDCNMPHRILDMEASKYGIPRHYNLFSTRGYECRIASLQAEYDWAMSFEPAAMVFLVVGGGKKTAEWCQRTKGAVHSGYESTKNVYSRINQQGSLFT